MRWPALLSEAAQIQTDIITTPPGAGELKLEREGPCESLGLEAALPSPWPVQSQPSCFWTLESLLGLVGCRHGNPMAKFLREALSLDILSCAQPVCHRWEDLVVEAEIQGRRGLHPSGSFTAWQGWLQLGWAGQGGGIFGNIPLNLR